MNLEEAITIVARWTIWNMFEAWTDEGWEALPEITEPDYERVAEAIEGLLPSDITFDEFDAAYKFLEARATDEEEANDE